MVTANAPVAAPSTIIRHAVGVYPAMAMLAGMQLDVFTPLRDGPLTGAEVAEAIGVKPTKLIPLLYALVAAELLAIQDDRFSNTPEADTYLVRGRPSYLAGREEFYADIWPALLKTAASIHAGAPQHKHNFHAMREDEMLAFFRGQHFYAVAAGEYLARTNDFSRFRHVLDVGGGSGGVAIGACQTCPELTATVVDLPRIIPVTRRFIEESSVAARVRTNVVDVTTGSPPGTYDVAIMRNLIQVLSLESAEAAVRNVARSLNPRGWLFVAGSVLDDTRQSPIDLVGQNLVFLNIYDDGLIYTEGEYRAVLAGAGFVDIKVQRRCMPARESVFTARLPE